MPSLPTETVTKLRATIDAATADPHKGIPGTAIVIVDRHGTELFAHASGLRGLQASTQPMTLTDSVFWIASCTKLVTGIACLQLVERGLLKLDDAAQLEKELCPELAALQVLRPEGTLEAKRVGITLRMLLTHTAGFGYSFFNPRLRDWGFPAGVDEFSGRVEDMLMPLLFQPGEGWEYGINIDWAGIALERATGQKLGDYMKENIFDPLGIKDMAMVPSPEMKAHLAYMHYRGPDGVIQPRDHLARASLIVSSEDEKRRLFHSGGGGLFARPQEYCKILAMLLNEGTSPTTQARILQPKTVQEMFTNQIPHLPNFARQGNIFAAKPELTHAVPELYPVPGDPPQGWGLTFMLTNGGATGRSTQTAMWAGLANCWYWCDPEHGIAGFVAAQILPFGDAHVLGLWGAVEAETYAALRAASAAAENGQK